MLAIFKNRLFLYMLLSSCILCLSGCRETLDKPVIEIPEGKVGLLAYGSLMSKASFEHTLGRSYTDSTYLVELNGYVRDWKYIRAFNDPAFLESYPEAREFDHYYVKNGDTLPLERLIGLSLVEAPESSMNGVLYFLYPEDLEEFDRREIGYERIQLQDSILNFHITEGIVYAYKALPDYTYSPTTSLNPVLIDRYLDLVQKAADSLDDKFRKKFQVSTLSPHPSIIIPDTTFRIRITQSHIAVPPF